MESPVEKLGQQCQKYVVPKGAVDEPHDFWAGALFFRVEELEVYQVRQKILY